jgi:hypothetical protein
LIDRHLADAETVVPDRVKDTFTDQTQNWLTDTPPTSPPPASPLPTSASRSPQIPKRFTLLIDPPKMIDKNYPMRKEKARTFIAGLYDSPNVELVHIGFGRKSVEELISGSFSTSYPDDPKPDKNVW